MLSGDELKAWRTGAGLTQPEAGTALGVTKMTIIRAEAKGAAAVSGAIELAWLRLTDQAPEPAAPAKASAPAAAKPKAAPATKAPAMDPKRLPRPYDFDKAPAFTRGLERLPLTNAFPGGATEKWDSRPASEGWQRIAGCIQICTASIPEPIPFRPEPAFGPRAILTRSGAVYDRDQGHRINAPGGERPARDLEPFQRAAKAPKRR